VIGVFVVLGSLIPVLLAFALLQVRQPAWLGWFLWAISVAIAIYAWLWWTRIIPSDGAKTYGLLMALWFTWAPITAFVLRTRKHRT